MDQFTYIGKETKFITNTILKIAFTTKDSIGKLLSIQYDHNQNKFHKCGIYQLIYPDCNTNFIGQIGRTFHVRFQEHFRDHKYSNTKSNFGQHLDNEGSVWPIENIMDIVHTTNKGRMLDTMQKKCNEKETKINNQINVKWKVKSNIIFEALLQKDTNRAQYNSTATRPPAHNLVTRIDRTSAHARNLFRTHKKP
jgi:hypothetical protein